METSLMAVGDLKPLAASLVGEVFYNNVVVEAGCKCPVHLFDSVRVTGVKMLVGMTKDMSIK